MAGNFPSHLFSSLCVLALLLVTSGCDAPNADEPRAEPLRPLVYTEHPELTPEGASVREARIVRELVHGSDAGWGSLQGAPKTLRLDSSEALGEAIFEALVSRDARAWDALWVPPQDYAALVHVDLDAAREFVDEAQGASLPVWQLFRPEPPSAAVPGGFGEVYALESLEMGEPRAVDGKIVEEEGDGPTAQYWGNSLRIRWRGTEQVFELAIPKILRVQRAGQVSIRLGSAIRIDRRMERMQAAGMHLKPELLRSQEYPFPLQVSNYWKYRRYRGDRAEEVDPFEEALSGVAESGGAEPGADAGAEGQTYGLASEVLEEVVSVDRYGTWRLVQLRRSYNDADLTKAYRWWLVLPRRIYLCVRACRNAIEDPAWLLSYMARQTPLYVFPLKDGAAWGVGGDPENPVFETRSIAQVETPAGTFDGVVSIVGAGPLGTFDRRIDARQARDVVWGEGVVRRVIYDGKDPLTEELVDVRAR